jgi:hypothetical protein
LEKKKDIVCALKRTSRCEEHELVQSEALSTGFNDSGSCGFGESESSDGQLGDLKESHIISDGADNDGNAVLLLAEVLNEAGDGKRRSVDS